MDMLSKGGWIAGCRGGSAAKGTSIIRELSFGGKLILTVMHHCIPGTSLTYLPSMLYQAGLREPTANVEMI